MAVQKLAESIVYSNAKGSVAKESGYLDTWYYLGLTEQKVDEAGFIPELASAIRHWISVKDKLTFLRQNMARADSRGRAKEVAISIDHLWAIGESQDWKCAYTGTPLEFTRGGDFGYNTNPNSCTIDRIDSDLDYAEGNVQLITWQANCAKNAMTHDQFIKLCKMVAKRH